MRQIYFVRHGQTDSNIERRYCGQTNVNLNDVGKKQAKKIAEILKDYKIDKIFSSDLLRVKMTAQEINKNHNLDIKYVKDLREINFGDFENLTFDEISMKYPEEKEKLISQKYLYTFPNGESIKTLYKRTNEAFSEIVNNNKEENILIVSHGGVISSIITDILSGDIEKYWNIEIDNATLSTINDNEGFLYLKNLNKI